LGLFTPVVLDEKKHFYHALDYRRRLLGLPWYKIAEQAGISTTVFQKLSRQESVSKQSMAKVTRWLEGQRIGSVQVR
jgi:hypothetical protein